MPVLGYNLEWFDLISNSFKFLSLKFDSDVNTVELVQDRTVFLKRIYYPDIQLSDLYLGNSITIYNRLMIIQSYANSSTENFMQDHEFRFLCIIEGKDAEKISSIFVLSKKFNLHMGRVRTATSEVFIELVGTDPHLKAAQFINSASSYADTSTKSYEQITEMLSHMEPMSLRQPCTLCIIKPHVVKSKDTGDLLKAINEAGFLIGGYYSIHMNSPMAEELLDIYTDVYRPYSSMLQHFTSSTVLALLIHHSRDQAVEYADYSVVETFRELCGPLKPEVAKAIRPNSLRALFGVDNNRNAVHCTDLAEDGAMEARYVFRTLADA